MTHNSFALAERRIPMGDDFLIPREQGALTPTELTSRTTALAPLIATHAVEAEQLRRPHDASWAALRQSGYFYQFVPEQFGGLVTDFDSFMDATLPIAGADASTAWVATFCAGHNRMLAYFPKEAQKEFWGDGPKYVVGPFVTVPPGRAERVPGGFRITGTWGWGTGIMHADWVVAMILLSNGDEAPQPAFTAFPAKNAQVLDTWFMDGLAGTGSNDIRVEDLFVPEHMVTDAEPIMSGSWPASQRPTVTAFDTPLVSFNCVTSSVATIGAARACLRSVRDHLDERIRQGGTMKQVDRPAMQMRLAEADLMVGAAELLLRDTGRKAFSLGSLDEADRVPARIGIRASSTYANNLCLKAVQHLAEGAGSSVHRSDQPFQRALRDLSIMCSHAGFEVDSAYEQHGRSMLSLPPTSMIF